MTKKIIKYSVVLIVFAALGYCAMLIYFDKWAQKIMPGFSKEVMLPIFTTAALFNSRELKVDKNDKMFLERLRMIGLNENECWVALFSSVVKKNYYKGDCDNLLKGSLPKFAVDLIEKDKIRIDCKDSLMVVQYIGKDAKWEDKSYPRKQILLSDSISISQVGDDVIVFQPIY